MEYKPEELKQLLYIGNGVIDQLTHFSKNYVGRGDDINGAPPQGMTDVEAERFVEQRRVAENLYLEMQNLAQEPFISWIKIDQSGKNKIILISRGFTPTDYHPLDYPDVMYANKLSPYAAKVLTSKVGSDFTFKGTTQKILYRDRYFIPKLRPFIDGIHNTIDLTSGTYSIDSLCKLIGIKIEDVTDEISDKIKEILAEAEFRAGVRRRIIDIIQLRDQPILDEYQTAVFRTPLTANLIITGSAGTGKTTVLINRISLATKPENLAEEERGSLTQQGLNLLKENKESWVLFTPTELLKNYLQQAFNKEGVPAYDKTIKVWHEERMELGKNVLGFLKVGDNRGIFVRSLKPFFIHQSSQEVNAYSVEFRKYYLRFIEKTFLEAVENLNEYQKINSIPLTFRNIKSFYESKSLQEISEKIVALIERLAQVREDVLQLRNTTDIKLDQFVNKIIREKKDILDQISEIIKESKSAGIKDEENLDEELEESGEAESQDILELTDDEKVQANQRLKTALLLFAERKIKRQTISSKGITSAIIDLLKNELNTYDKELTSIGEERIIFRTANRLTAGYVANLIQQIPRYYLRFRNEILSNENQNDFQISEIKNIKEKRLISDQEIDIIINEMLINTNKHFKKNLVDLTRDSRNSILENVKSMYKNIVTVDEATDFSSTSLSCMYYLSNPLIKSYTLTGDLMQRVTNVGIEKWDECYSFLDTYDRKPLNKVYRQSYKLLGIASKLYEHFIGEVEFESAFEKDENDPEPLIFNNSDQNEFKEWITARILEIYSITKGKATIALFVAEDSEIDSIYDLIIEPLSDNNLEVEKCKEGKILSVGSKVRIFSVEYIKGLEFESVFFIDIDEIYKRKPNLVDKYLYVGLTRAGSFLAVTYKDQFPESLKFIKDSFKEGNWSWLTK